MLCEHETDNYFLCPPSCSESIWHDRVTHLPVIFPYAYIWKMKPCDTLWLEPCNLASIYTNRHRKRTSALLESCCFKSQLRQTLLPLKDLLPWEDTLERKRGERKEWWHVWIFSYNILHLFPFFLPETTLASFDKSLKQWGCVKLYNVCLQ